LLRRGSPNALPLVVVGVAKIEGGIFVVTVAYSQRIPLNENREGRIVYTTKMYVGGVIQRMCGGGRQSLT